MSKTEQQNNDMQQPQINQNNPDVSEIKMDANDDNDIFIKYFIPPVTTQFMQWGQTFMVIFFLALMFISVVLSYIYVNMSEYQNRISVIANSYLFGYDAQNKFETYIKNAQAESIATVMNNIQSTSDTLNITNNRLNDKASRLSKQVSVDIPNQYAQSNNLGISIQKNIGQIRDTVSKLGGAFMLNNYMTDGAVKTIQKINSGKSPSSGNSSYIGNSPSTGNTPST